MPGNKTSAAQIDYERIEALKAKGLRNAEAVRIVAEERGKSENAVRANQYSYRKKLRETAVSGYRGGRSATSQVLTVDGAIAQAVGTLERAMAAIDGEVEAAKAEFEAAQSRYDELVVSAKDRKAELAAKIKALS
jgi:uncharacterized protein YoaH (UPF0181 family)